MNLKTCANIFYHNARILYGSRLWKNTPYHPLTTREIPSDYLGINVASGEKPETDNYVIERLKDLGIKHVRIDLSNDSRNDSQKRFIKLLMQENFTVLIRLIQSKSDAQHIINDKNIQKGWHDMLENAANEFSGTSLYAFEIGSVPNRKKWSGYRYSQYFKCWEIARKILLGNVKLAGPNISDFEPLHAMAILAGMEKSGGLPDIHTVNLFVERVKVPEAYDHRVLGRFFRETLKLNLLKKAAIFHDISKRYNIPETMCTHTCWNRQRIARWHKDVEKKRVDYLIRYILSAALSGAFSRIYWGPLIGRNDGLIDDKKVSSHNIERVAYYPSCSDELSNFNILPAFHALGQINAHLSNSRVEAISYGQPDYHVRISPEQGKCVDYHWTRDDTTNISFGR